MKKILFVIESLQFGGAERVLCELAKYFNQKGYMVNVVTFLRGEQEYHLPENIKRINCEIGRRKFTKLITGVKSLRKIINESSFDVCISFDILANVLLLLSAKKKHFVVISERNAPRQTEISVFSKVLRKLLYWKADRIVFQTVEAAHFYSKWIQKRSVIIPNPVIEGIPYKEGENKTIVAVGRLAPQKNYRLMLDAFAKFHMKNVDYVLQIYGDGPSKDELIRYRDSLGLSFSVVFCGNQKNIHKIIQKSSIFLMTSNYEGIPNALLEAMAMGFPVVATDCPSGGVAMLISDEKKGILIKKAEAEEIANALDYLANNPSARKMFGENAKYVRQAFSVETIGQKWEKLINEGKKGK